MLKTPKYKVHEKRIYDILSDEVEEIDAVVQNARKNLDIPVEPAMPCVKQMRILTAKAPSQKVAVSKAGGERPPALSEGRHSLTRGEREMEAFESQRCTHLEEKILKSKR